MSSSNATYIQSHILRRFNIIKKVGSGAYGHVWKVEQKTTRKVFALKKIFDAFQHATDAQRTYREIQILRQTEHPNIIKLHDTLKADNNKDVYLVFEFMEADLHNVISEDILKEVHIRFIIYQMAKALKYLHSGFVIHRDLKPSNILVNSNCTIKLCDFGLVRSISSKSENGPILTQGVATRWYRAPEVLLGSKSYSTPADIWSFGCIIYQILAQKPLFAGNSTLDQLEKICQFTGYPTEEDVKAMESQVSKSMLKEIKMHLQSQSAGILKQIPTSFRDLIEKMIVFNPNRRITIQQILSHEVVKTFHKPQQELTCKKVITTSVDDNKKFTVDEYRKLIYGTASNSSRPIENQPTIVKSNSAKYIKKPSELNSQLSRTMTSQTQKEEKKDAQLHKKFSYENLKTLNKTSLHNVSGQFSGNQGKKQEKQTLKYVRSAKEFLRNTNTHQEINRSICNKKPLEKDLNKKSSASLGQVSRQGEEKEQNLAKNYLSSAIGNGKIFGGNINKPTYVSKTFYSPKNYLESSKYYVQLSKNHLESSKNYLQPTKSSSNQNINGGVGWNSSKSFLNKETKDKTYLFKSQKYIRDFNKGNSLSQHQTSILEPKKERKEEKTVGDEK